MNKVESQIEIAQDSFINEYTGLGTEHDKGRTAVVDRYWRGMTTEECHALYRKNAFARAVAEKYADDSVYGGWTVGVDREKQEKIDSKLNLQNVLHKAIVSARVFGYSCVYLVTNAKQTWRPMAASEKLTALHVFEAPECRVIEIERRLNSEYFRLPLLWEIVSVTDFPGAALGYAQPKRVHASRMIYFEGGNNLQATRDALGGVGETVFQSCYDQIRNKTQFDQSIATLVQESTLDVMKIKEFGAMSASEQHEEMESRLQTMQRSKSVCNTVMISNEDSYESVQRSFNGLAEVDNVHKESLSAASDIPVPNLFGRNAGSGLNNGGESQSKKWAKANSKFQRQNLAQPLKKIYSFFYDESESTEIRFIPLDEPGQLELAEVEEKKAKTAETLLKSGIMSIQEVREKIYGITGAFEPDVTTFNQEDGSGGQVVE